MPVKQSPFDLLSDGVLLHILVLLCASAPPQTPGVCWVAPVCQRWRQLAVKCRGLRVLFQQEQDAHVRSFEVWISRHAPQVIALACTSRWSHPLGPLRALAHVARAAAAAGQPLPLQRLVLRQGYYLDPMLCSHTLAGLFMALPQLQHLHLHLEAYDDTEDWEDETSHQATCAALRPLRHLTALTSLYLLGPFKPLEVEDEDYPDTPHWAAEQLACLPSSLAHLEFHHSQHLFHANLDCDRLTGLTALRLSAPYETTDEFLPRKGFTGLQRLRSLRMDNYTWQDEWMLDHRGVLDGVQLNRWADEAPASFGPLVNLRSLDLLQDDPSPVTSALVEAAAPHLTQLCLQLPWVHSSTAAVEAATEVHGWQDQAADLRPVAAVTGLRALLLEARECCTALPLGLAGLPHLTRLHLHLNQALPATTCAWVCAVQGLVNLQVLTVPAAWTLCWHHWLTGLTKLGVLELQECPEEPVKADRDLAAAAAHLQRLVRPAGGSWAAGATSSSSSGPSAGAARGSSSSSSRAGEGSKSSARLQLLCIKSTGDPDDPRGALYRHLQQQGLAGGVALFSGSLRSCVQCGWQLWPQPTAARLQQLLGDMV